LEHTSEKKKTLENIEEAIKNGRSRDTGNIDEKQIAIGSTNDSSRDICILESLQVNIISSRPVFIGWD
jgi:hypothetical protein